MAPKQKAPLSAFAARKAREQAQAQRSGTRRASGSKQAEAAPASLLSQRSTSGRHDMATNDEEVASGLEVMIPLPTASQAVASRPTARPTVPSPSRHTPRSSVTKNSTSIAASRPKRSSSTTESTRPSIAQAISTPKPTKAAAAKATQSTPRRGSAKEVSSLVSTPASSRKKRKTMRDSNDGLDQAVQDILDEFNIGELDNNEASGVEALEPEQPPRKKRAIQPETKRPLSKVLKDTVDQAEPSASPKRTPAKRSPATAKPIEATPAKKTPARKSATKEASPGKLKKADAVTKRSPAKRKEASPAKNKTLTADEKRLKAAMRYFADSPSQHGKTHGGPSAMPIEDEATGFLAFENDGNESDRSSAAELRDEEEEAEEHSDGEGDNSSQDDEEEKEQVPDSVVQVSALSKARQILRNPKGKSRDVGDAESSERIILDLDEVGPQPTVPALTREALLDAIPYSNFNPVLDGRQRNMLVVENKRKRGKEALYFGLRHVETLVFLGVGHVEVLRGRAQVGGAFISSSAEGFRAAKIFAPICNPLPVLKSVPESQYSRHIVAQGSSQKTQEAHSDHNVQAMLNSGFDTVVKVTPLSSPITTLGQVCPIGGLAAPFSPTPNLELSKVHQLSTIKVLLAPDTNELCQKQKNVLANGTFSTVGLSATYIPHKWQYALSPLSMSALSASQHPQEESVVALIRGSKKVGKSTFTRLALERLLSMGSFIGGSVAYLELDLGQSDFGPPGMVALHLFSLSDTIHNKSQQDQDEEAEGTEQVLPTTESGREVAVSQNEPRDAASKPAGSCITLGPGWCQPRVPIRAHFIGDVSPRDDPESYVAAVHDLIEHFRAVIQPGQSDEHGQRQRVPLVINTQGWIKGLGADLAARLEPMLRPTHIFDVIPRGSPDPVPPPIRGRPWLDADGAILGSGPEIITLESVSQLEFMQGAFGQRESNSGSNIHRLGSARENGSLKGTDEKDGPGDGGSVPPRYITDVGSKLAPAEARLLNTMSYLYATQLAPAGFGNTSQQGSWDFSEPLVHRRPLVVDVCKGLKAGIRVLALGSSVPDSLKLLALNSSIVAIVVSDHCDATVDEEVVQQEQGHQVGATWKHAFDGATQIAQQGPGLPTRCVGLGIVRSIDATSGRIHLLTPIDPAFLHEVQASSNCSIGLVKGALELPVWASLDFEAIKEARESRLDVATFHTPVDAATTECETKAEQLLAGMPRNQVPYLEWPNAANAPSRQKGKHSGANSSMSSTLIQLGSEKRRVRRNLMRKSQFA